MAGAASGSRERAALATATRMRAAAAANARVRSTPGFDNHLLLGRRSVVVSLAQGGERGAKARDDRLPFRRLCLCLIARADPLCTQTHALTLAAVRHSSSSSDAATRRAMLALARCPIKNSAQWGEKSLLIDRSQHFCTPPLSLSLTLAPRSARAVCFALQARTADSLADQGFFGGGAKTLSSS